MATFAKTSIGTVTDYDPDLYAVRVRLEPSGVVTGWIPIASHWVGKNFGLVMGPAIGDMVRVDYVNWQQQAALIGGRFFNDDVPPPPVPSGEMWAVHSSGAFLKLTNDGKVTSSDKAGSTVVLNGDGTGSATFSAGYTVNANIQINGTLKVSGDITDNSGMNTDTVAGMRNVFNSHTHSDPQGGSTGGPSGAM